MSDKERMTRAEYAMGLAKLQYPTDSKLPQRGLLSRLLDRELSTACDTHGRRRST